MRLATLSKIYLGLISTAFVLIYPFSLRFPNNRQKISNLKMSGDDLTVMINGMPGLMALETAKVCVDRGIKLAPYGFTGPNCPAKITVEGKKSSIDVELVPGPGISNIDHPALLKKIKSESKNFVIVDFTHPSAILNNLRSYCDANCNFVMGTTGGDPTSMNDIFNKAQNYAVIAPNMAKQIVALQLGLLEVAKRFPGSFGRYVLTVTESHQSTKADTSGTAKAIVTYLKDLRYVHPLQINLFLNTFTMLIRGNLLTQH